MIEMITDTQTDSQRVWNNQRQLMQAVARLGRRLEAHGENRPQGAPATVDTTPLREGSRSTDDPSNGTDWPPTLRALCKAFELSPFERDVLMLCAAVELDGSFGARIAAAHGNPRRPYPTFGLALSVLEDPHWSALTPEAPLRRWRLVEMDARASLTASPIIIDEWALHYLAGTPHIDPRVAEVIEPCTESPPLPPSHQALTEQVVRMWQASARPSQRPVVQLCGVDPATKRAIAVAACLQAGVRLHVLRAVDVPSSPTEREFFCRLWEREAALLGSALLMDCDGPTTADDMRHACAWMNRLQAIVLVSTRDALRGLTRPTARIDTVCIRWEERRSLWIEALGSWAKTANGQIDAVAAQFDLAPHEIRAAGEHVLRSNGAHDPSEPPDPAALGRDLWDQCRVLARKGLDELSQRIEPKAHREDLILPEAQMQILGDIATHLRQRTTVYERWGFADKLSRGLGVSALFWGASGTGKTTAAEVLAGQLRLDIYRIDLSSVVSKYIGETEKNLRRVFDAAEAGGTILLFDEADALFGKRSEVKDSHDRHANIEVSYLLQRMESYRGLAILTTNLKDNLDSAFLRRIRYVVRFPFPDANHRAEIWRRALPGRTPTRDLDIPKLARLNIAGGSIHNIALNAAFHAADENQPVGMRHLLRATRAEYAKLDKPLTETEIKGWV